jgi:hypothetical protein
MLPVRLRYVSLLIAGLVVAGGLLPSPAHAGIPHHPRTLSRLCQRAPGRCLALTQHQRLKALKHVRPDSNEALEDFDEWDVGTDSASDTATVVQTTASDPNSAPPWARARRAADPLAARLIVWRKLSAPRPPPSL